jgi:enterochelin esterase-like enzyme
MKKVIYLLTLLGLSCKLNAQVFEKSIIVSGDSVSFILSAPSATIVNIVCWGTSPYATCDTLVMLKVGNSWMLTLHPFTSGFYYYQFQVDGAPVYNRSPKSYYSAKNTWINAFEVRSPTDMFDVRKDGPFGNFNICTYISKVTGEFRKCVVYTPSEYDGNPSKKYPVLYLLSDFGEDETAWMYQGLLNDIMDNAIAKGLINPMLVVLENINVSAPTGSLVQGPDVLDSLFITDLVPFIDSNFHTIDSAKYRAIAGCLAGSSEAASIFIKHNNTFHNLGIFSLAQGFDTELYNPASFAGLEIDLLFLGAGIHDVTYSDITALHNSLSTAAIDHVMDTHEGNFNWLVWRKNLYAMAQLLFR